MRKRIAVAIAAALAVIAGVAWLPVASGADPVTTSSDMISLCSARTADPDTGVAGWAQNCVKTMTSPSPSPSATTPPPPVAYPGPTTAGVHGITLTTDSRCTLATNNEVVSNKHFTCSHELAVSATNVTINDSWLDHGINNWTAGGGHSFHLNRVTVGPASGCDAGNGSGFAVGATNFTADSVYTRGETDGFRVSGTDGAAISITNSYISVCTHSGDHSDGIQSDGNNASLTTIQHNTVDQRMAVAGSTTANVFWPGLGALKLDDNLFAGGGGFAVQLDTSGTSTKQVVTNNKFNSATGSWQYGYSDSNCAEMSPWTGNVAVTIDSSYNITGTGASVPCS